MKKVIASILATAANTGLLCSIILPLAFMFIPFFDGGQKDYQTWGCFAGGAAMLFSLLPLSLFMGLSELALRLELDVIRDSAR